MPPSGIEGVEAMDDGKALQAGSGKAVGIGALAIGNIKYQTQRGLLESHAQGGQAALPGFAGCIHGGAQACRRRLSNCRCCWSPRPGARLRSRRQGAACRSVVLDLFNDLDVRALAVASRGRGAQGGKFDARRLLAAAQDPVPAGAMRRVWYTDRDSKDAPGCSPGWRNGRTLFGNPPDTVARAQGPDAIFSHARFARHRASRNQAESARRHCRAGW